jgi:peroxiredoxin
MRSALPALALALAACSAPAAEGHPPPAPAAGQEFKLVLRHHPGPGDANLGALKGKVLLVDFWATWCGPCHEAATAYQGLYARYHAQGLEVYGVSVDEDPKQIDAFVAAQGVQYPILLDPAAQVSGPRYEIDSIPVALLVDKQGRLRFTHRGFDPADMAAVTTEIEQLLAEPAPAP